jgi:hypothetical protein
MLRGYFCIVKFLLLVITLLVADLKATDFHQGKWIRVTDTNKELLTGARVDVIGTGKTLYTNLKGECFISNELLSNCSGLEITCVSYRSVRLKSLDTDSEIVLEMR